MTLTFSKKVSNLTQLFRLQKNGRFLALRFVKGFFSWPLSAPSDVAAICRPLELFFRLDELVVGVLKSLPSRICSNQILLGTPWKHLGGLSPKCFKPLVFESSTSSSSEPSNRCPYLQNAAPPLWKKKKLRVVPCAPQIVLCPMSF